jgi:cytochrome P450
MGPIYEWKVMGTLHIWIETDKIAHDLFVTRQRNYCDRNALPGAVGVREGSEILPLMGYGEQFRRYKNFMHLIMRHAMPKTFYGVPSDENKRTVRRLLESPEHWSEHMLVHCARTIAGVAWGDPEHGSKLLTIIPVILKAVSPAGPIVNKLTFLANLPEAISPFKQAEKVRKQEMTDAFVEALEDVRQKHEAGNAPDCWSKIWLEKEKGSEHLDSYEAAHAIGSSSFVAIATVGGPLHAFFLAMCHYPSWQLQVQEEIDRVCGDRVPTVADFPQLPRLRATVKEIVRWRQATPLGVPHVAMEDDVYDGYLIPKGAILHANH